MSLEQSQIKLEDLSIIEWIVKNGIVNEKLEPISFKQHPFLYDIYCDWSPQQVYKKAAQVGMSVAQILKSLFWAKTRGYNIIYTLPADNDVWEFVPTKVDKIIQANPSLRSLLQTDKTEIKQIANRFIYFKGTRSKSAPIMTTADLLIHDEIDRSEQEIIEQYESRISKSEYRGVWKLSNPSTAMNGVDIEWQKSDKKEWFITCQACKVEQILEWDASIDYKRGLFICKECGGEITDSDRKKGKWKATGQGRVSGWHISQMMCPWISARQLIETRESKGVEYFNNFVLGEPYDASDIKIRRELIIDLWTPKELKGNEWFLGVDSGLTKHYILGVKEGITEIGSTDDWEDIEFLIKKYNPITVIDALPDLTIPMKLSEKYPKVYRSYYSLDKSKADIWEWGRNEDVSVVRSQRNRLIDIVIDDMARGAFLISVPGEVLRKYISHWLTMKRVREENSVGVNYYDWQATGADHWVHATAYWWLARTQGQAEMFEPLEKAKEGKGPILELAGGAIVSLKDYLMAKFES